MPEKTKFYTFFVTAALLIAPETALSASSSSVWGNYLAGKFAEKQGKHGLAADYFGSALEKGHSRQEIVSGVQHNLLLKGDVKQAIELAAKPGSLDDGSSSLLRIINYIDKGKYQEAEKEAASLPAIGLGSLLQPMLSSWILAAQGKYPEAIANLEAISETSGLSPLVNFHIGLISEIGGNYDKAEASYIKAIEQSENKTQRFVEVLSNFYLRKGLKDRFEKTLEDFSRDNPGNWFIRDYKNPDKTRMEVGSAREGVAETLFDFASLVYGDENQEDTFGYINMALFIKPGFPQAKILLASALEKEERFDEAMKVYDSIGKNSHLHSRAKMKAAACLHKMGRTDEAITRLQAIAAEIPSNYDPLIYIAEILREKGDNEGSAKYYTEAISRAGSLQKWHWSLFFARGTSLEQSGNWDQAEQDFKKALELMPGQPDVLNYLGYSWLVMDRNLQEARKMIEKALEQRPGDAHIMDSYGWALYKSGDYKNAIVQLEKALEIMPDDATLNDHLGDAYWMAGRRNEADFQWQRALQFKPDTELKAKLEAKLAGGDPNLNPAPQSIDKVERKEPPAEENLSQ